MQRVNTLKDILTTGRVLVDTGGLTVPLAVDRDTSEVDATEALAAYLNEIN